MANFEPKKIDISSINDGQRYENGQGIDANAINSPIEAGLLLQQLATNQPILEENGGEVNVVIENAETNPQFKFQNLKRQQEFDRIANEQNEQNERIGNNEKNIQNIKAILTGNNQFVKITSSQTYASRVTADGANIFDDQLTPVQEISGSTVKCDNLLKFPYDNMGGFTGKNMTVSILNDGGIKIKGELTSDEVQTGATYRRIFFYNVSSSKLNFTAEKLTLNVYANTGLKTSKIVAVVGEGDFSFDECGLNKGTTTLTRISDGTQMCYFFLDIYPGEVFDCVVYLMLSEGTTPKPYQPYFTGLKHSYINSIVSTGKNLFDKASANLGYELGSQGQLVASSSWFVSDYIPVQEGKSIYISGKISSGLGNAFYDANKNFITMINASIGAVTIPQGARYMRFNSNQENLGTAQIEYGLTATSYEPYKQSVFQLPQTVELGEYDKILPQTGEIVRATGYATSEAGFTDEEIATYNNAVVSNDRKSLVYELATATTVPINAPKVYTVWNGGSETILQGETDNSQFGAMPTITQTYFGKVGEE